MAWGVLQKPPPVQPPPIDTDSQAPPLAVVAAVEKAKFAPVLAITSVCGSGFGPACSFVNVIPFTWLNTSGPTVTLTGTVAVLDPLRNKSWPVNVPAVRPALGRFGTEMDAVASEGAVPPGGV